MEARLPILTTLVVVTENLHRTEQKCTVTLLWQI